MDYTGLKLMLEGIEAKRVRRRYKSPVMTKDIRVSEYGLGIINA
jgi:hypothetical protein